MTLRASQNEPVELADGAGSATRFAYDAVGWLPRRTTPAGGHAPTTGRFLTPDTWRGDLMWPWTQNGYVYAGNNPMSLWDPTGNLPCDLGESCYETNSDGEIVAAYFFEGYDSDSTRTIIDTWRDLEGIYKEYSEKETERWHYYVYRYEPGNPKPIRKGPRTFTRANHSHGVSFTPHTPDTLTQYTEEERTANSGPPPEEVTVAELTFSIQTCTEGGGGACSEPARAPVWPWLSGAA